MCEVGRPSNGLSGSIQTRAGSLKPGARTASSPESYHRFPRRATDSRSKPVGCALGTEGAGSVGLIDSKARAPQRGSYRQIFGQSCSRKSRK